MVSTLAEAEFLLGALLQYKAAGISVNVLLGIPLFPSAVPRLLALIQQLGSTGISLLVDSPHHVAALTSLRDASKQIIPVFILVDIRRYHTTGAPFQSSALDRLMTDITFAEMEGICRVMGFYSDGGNNDRCTGPLDALRCLETELMSLKAGAEAFEKHSCNVDPGRNLCLSFGTELTAAFIELLSPNVKIPALRALGGQELAEVTEKLRECLALWRGRGNWHFELHAGAYALWDLRHDTTASGILRQPGPPGSPGYDGALTILAEVASVYPHRAPAEVLLAAGTLALGHEPCPNVSSWATAIDWEEDKEGATESDGRKQLHKTSWELTRIDQDQSTLSLVDNRRRTSRFAPAAGQGGGRYCPASQGIGRRVRLWPNHAGIAGAMYDYYVVVDGDQANGELIMDVWSRCKGR